MNPWSFSRRVGYLSYSKIEARLPPNMNPRVGAEAKRASRPTFDMAESRKHETTTLKVPSAKNQAPTKPLFLRKGITGGFAVRDYDPETPESRVERFRGYASKLARLRRRVP
jgi:hypothetical protein